MDLPLSDIGAVDLALIDLQLRDDFSVPRSLSCRGEDSVLRRERLKELLLPRPAQGKGAGRDL
jgi:hypothetical protein